MIAKGIVLYVTLNIRLIIEEGGVICDMVFVIRCLSVFLCFKMSFSLISKNFHISYTRTPNPLTPLQAISLLLPQEKNPAKPEPSKTEKLPDSLWKELGSSLPKFN